MRTQLSLIALLLLTACSGQNAEYTVQEKKVMPDHRSVTEDKASNLLLAPENFASNIETIRNDHRADFSWQTFWNNLNHQNILKDLSDEQLKMVLQLSEESCKNEDIGSFTLLTWKERERLSSSAQDIFVNQAVSLFEVCQKVPDIDQSTKILKQLKIRIVKSEKQASIIQLMDRFANLLKVKWDYTSFNKISKSLSESDWNDIFNSVKKSQNIDSIIQVTKTIKTLNEDSEELVSNFVNEILNRSKDINQVVNSIGKNSTLVIMKEYGSVIYNRKDQRDLLKDLKAIVADENETSIEKAWENLKLLQNIMDDKSIIKSAQFQAAMPVFNQAVKNVEKLVLERNNDAKKFINDLSDSDVLAKWIKFRTSNAKSNSHRSHTIYSEDYSISTGRTSLILTSRLDYYAAGTAEDKKQKASAYCEVLEKQGIKGKVIESLNEVSVLASNKTNGCVSFDSKKRDALALTGTELIFDDDLTLKLSNTEVTVTAQKLDLNFLDLSSTLKQTDINPPSASRNLNAVVLPMIIGIKHQMPGQPLKRHYFRYDYLLKEADDGPSYYTWSPLQGHKGGDLSLKIPKDQKSFIPSLLSMGEEGQKASAPMKGGEGYNILFRWENLDLIIEDEFEGELVNFIDEDGTGSGFGDSTRNQERIKTLLKSIDISKADIKVVDLLKYLPKSDEDYHQVERNYQDAQGIVKNCAQTVDTNTCILNTAKKDAVSKLMSELYATNHQLASLNSNIRLRKGANGPMPQQGQTGDSGRTIFEE